MILNTKKEDSLQQIMAVSAEFSITILRLLMSGGWTSVLQALIRTEFTPGIIHPYETSAGKRAQVKHYSHYLQPKVVRVRERIEAEHKLQNTPSEPAPQPTPNPTRKPIASSLAVFYRRPHVYHIPSLIILARHCAFHPLA